MENEVNNNETNNITNEVKQEQIPIVPEEQATVVQEQVVTPIQTNNVAETTLVQNNELDKKKGKTAKTVMSIFVILLCIAFGIYWVCIRDYDLVKKDNSITDNTASEDSKELEGTTEYNPVEEFEDFDEEDEEDDDETPVFFETKEEKEKFIFENNAITYNDEIIGREINGKYYCYSEYTNEFELSYYYDDDDEEVYDEEYNENLVYGNLVDTFYSSETSYIEFYDNNTFKKVYNANDDVDEDSDEIRNGTYKISKNKYIFNNDKDDYLVKYDNYLFSIGYFDTLVYMHKDDLDKIVEHTTKIIKDNITSDYSVLATGDTINKVEIVFDGLLVGEYKNISKYLKNNNYTVLAAANMYGENFPGEIACYCGSSYFSFASGSGPYCGKDYYVEYQKFIIQKDKVTGLDGWG